MQIDFMIKQAAGAYLINDIVIIHGKIEAIYGGWFVYEPYITLSIDANDSEIGSALRQALSQSKKESELDKPIADEEYKKGFMKPILKSAKVTSYRKLVQNSIYCSVAHINDRIEITPTHNGGTKGSKKGFGHLPDQLTAMDIDVSDQILGKTLKKCFARCTSIYNDV